MKKLKFYVQIFTIFVLFFAGFQSYSAIAKEKCQSIEGENIAISKHLYKGIYDSEEKKVYLTFDDGPSYKVTNMLLNTLKENEVKATFFVVGKEIVGREDILKRIYEDGHSIGLHTYSHNFKKIYKDNKSFIEEMKDTEELINSTIGIRPKIIRFPGGSSGSLNEDLLKEIHDNGYKVFDWNVDLCDGVNPTLSTERLLKNAKKAKGDQNNRIILAHCNYNNTNTCRALTSIIKYYKENGYVFRSIDEDTEEYHYRIKRKLK